MEICQSRTTLGTFSSDYIRVFYRVDGGPEILFAEQLGSLASATTTGSAFVTGSTLQLVMRGRDTQTGTFLGFPLGFTMDNVVVTSVPVLYSRKNGNWNDNAPGTGTWSATGYTGAACGCLPNNGQVARIGNAFTVDLNVSSSVGGLNVQTTGLLRFNTSGQTLSILGGLVRVESGGSIASLSAAITGEQIIFNADLPGASFQVDAGGSAAVEDIVLAAGATNLHYLIGDGTLAVSDDILIQADDATLTNNFTTAVAVADRIEFSAGTTGASFVNNGTLTSATVFFDDLNNRFVNNGTVTSSILVNNATDNGNVFTNASGATANLAAINLNNGDFTINNSGTINQSGNFSNIDTGSNGNFNNLASGVWNWSLTPNTAFDTDMATVLDCAAPGNTFNYNAAGNQRIIPAQYGNLTLSGSGAKDAHNASFSVNGNWTNSGVSFTPGTGTVTLNGTGSTVQTITTNAQGFNNLTFNNSSSNAMVLSGALTVANVLTMTAGRINLNGNTLALSSSAAVALVYTAGWAFGGTFQRAFANATTIMVGTVRGHFPLGANNAVYRPFFVGVNSTAGTAGTMALTHTNASSTTAVSVSDGAATILYRHDSFWTPAVSGITAGTWNLRLGGANFGTISNAAHLRVMTATGVVATHAAGSGLGDPDWRANRTGLTITQLTANNFHLASTNVGSPLPVELVWFTAAWRQEGVLLNWKTASELNNDYFTIERSPDGEGFAAIAQIPGKGTTRLPSVYEWIDMLPLAGTSYYRLRQTDFDGTFAFSQVAMVVNSHSQTRLLVSPNPVTDGRLLVTFAGGPPHTEVLMRLVRETGQVVFQQRITTDEAGAFQAQLEVDTAPGICILSVPPHFALSAKILFK